MKKETPTSFLEFMKSIDWELRKDGYKIVIIKDYSKKYRKVVSK